MSTAMSSGVFSIPIELRSKTGFPLRLITGAPQDFNKS